MQEKVAFWMSMAMLVCIGIAALTISLHYTGMPISGWGLICSAEDADGVSCFRDWITSGAAVLTGVAIVFAVAQVREANRQGDAATRASLVHLKSELLAEKTALGDTHRAYFRLGQLVGQILKPEDLAPADSQILLSALPEIQKQLQTTEPFLASGVAIGDLPRAREEFSKESSHMAQIAFFAHRAIASQNLDEPFFKLCQLGLRERYSDLHFTMFAYERELERALAQATQKIARLDAEVFAGR